MKVIDLSDEESLLGFKSLDEGRVAVVSYSEAQLQRLQGTLVDVIASEEGPEWARDLLDSVQSQILTMKQIKHVKVIVAVKKPLAAGEIQVVNAELSRGGTAKTLVILKRLSGEFAEALVAQPRLNFAIKAPLTQIAARKRSCVFALLPGESGDGLLHHVEYFKSRQRAGLAKIEGDIEVALIPPGPLARTLLGQDLLNADPSLSQLAIGLILLK